MKTTSVHLTSCRPAMVLLSWLAMTPVLVAQSSESVQVLTLGVQELNSVMVASTVVALDRDTGTVKEEQAKASARFIWTSNADARKMTVSCADAGTGASLRIAVKEVSFDLNHIGGYPAIELVDPTPRDLIRAAPKSAGTCLVEFSVRILKPASQKSLMDVLYTVTSA